MKVLITSGGTTEKIDEVRKIKNMASGMLGSLIAEEFLKQSEADITYVCSRDAITPADSEIETVKIESVSELAKALTKLLMENKFDAVIHAMAVSDYAVRHVISAADLSAVISESIHSKREFGNDPDDTVKAIHTAILQSRAIIDSDKKISSDIDNLVIVMDKTPKVIQIIKQLQPDTVLVGFKLLVDASESKLLEVGHNLLMRNICDFVLANDLKQIHGDYHTGMLINPDYSYQLFHSKQEIAHGIVVSVLKKIGGNR